MAEPGEAVGGAALASTLSDPQQLPTLWGPGSWSGWGERRAAPTTAPGDETLLLCWQGEQPALT